MSYIPKGSIIGATNLYGTYAARPAAGTLGRVYQASDVPFGYFDNGTIWVPRVGTTPLVIPPTTGWTNVDSSGKTSTHTTYAHGKFIYGGDFTTGEDWRLEYRTAPSTPYTIKACIIPMLRPVNSNSCGIGFRNSTSGNVVFWDFYYASGVARIQIRQVTASGNGATPTFSGATAPTDLAGAYALTLPASGGLWLSIGDDGTTSRTYGISMDGQTFSTIATQTRTTHITADQVTFQCGLSGTLAGTGESQIALASWS